jgi:hypothetical protein
MIYTNKGMLLDKVLCDVIPCVSPLIDHGSRPIKALEFLTLLYNRSLTEFDYLVFHDNLPGLLNDLEGKRNLKMKIKAQHIV